MKKCIFFDRDGVINKSPGPGYVERLEDFHILPYIFDVMRIVKEKGYEIIVITNQRGVARGIVSKEIVESMHDKLKQVLHDEHEIDLLDVFCCPHENDECECRKPKPGMILDAAKKHDIDLEQSWMIGDNEKDVEAGHSAGCKTVLISRTVVKTKAELQVKDLKELEWLLSVKL